MQKNSLKSKCLPPCTSVEYVVELKSKDAARDENAAVYINIGQTVQITRSAFVVDHFTLLNRLGGTIGICKEALWCILFLVGLLGSGKLLLEASFCPANVVSDGKVGYN